MSAGPVGGGGSGAIHGPAPAPPPLSAIPEGAETHERVADGRVGGVARDGAQALARIYP